MISLEEAKRQCNIELDYTDDDALLQSLIAAATNYIEGEINAHILISPKDHIHKGILQKDETIRINEAPFKDIKAYQGEQLVAEDQYEIIATYDSFVFRAKSTFSNLKLSYKLGYDPIPPALRQAILIAVSDFYESKRSSLVVGLIVSETKVIQQLVKQYKRRYW